MNTDWGRYFSLNVSMAALVGLRIAARSNPRILPLVGGQARRLASTAPNASSVNAVIWGVGGVAAAAVIVTVSIFSCARVMFITLLHRYSFSGRKRKQPS